MDDQRRWPPGAFRRDDTLTAACASLARSGRHPRCLYAGRPLVWGGVGQPLAHRGPCVSGPRGSSPSPRACERGGPLPGFGCRVSPPPAPTRRAAAGSRGSWIHPQLSPCRNCQSRPVSFGFPISVNGNALLFFFFCSVTITMLFLFPRLLSRSFYVYLLSADTLWSTPPFIVVRV